MYILLVKIQRAKKFYNENYSHNYAFSTLFFIYFDTSHLIAFFMCENDILKNKVEKNGI